eukprot:TRINITY_DN240_c0_g1_i1.p1 TRINITY_DN240_c0_g1~~TRINITY_DN240_c0_g1_i1.p1  ORF type:complete len:114 (+),score=21.52 TRINITY_DN240_c0_g1_i1:40-381(+)
MDDLHNTEEAHFIQEDVKAIISESCEAVLAEAVYSSSKVSQYTSDLCETVLKRLTFLNKPFKYVVTATIMQKTGTGLHTACSCYWDSTSDAPCVHRYENDSMRVVVTVFGLFC